MLSKGGLYEGSGSAAVATGGEAFAQGLASVSRELSQAVDSLICSGPGAPGVAHLSSALAALHQLNAKQASPETALSMQDRTHWLGPLKEVAARAAQAERLLGTAAAFYTNWFSARPVAAGGYTADGCWAVVEGSGGLRLEA